MWLKMWYSISLFLNNPQRLVLYQTYIFVNPSDYVTTFAILGSILAILLIAGCIITMTSFRKTIAEKLTAIKNQDSNCDKKKAKPNKGARFYWFNLGFRILHYASNNLEQINF